MEAKSVGWPPPRFPSTVSFAAAGTVTRKDDLPQGTPGGLPRFSDEAIDENLRVVDETSKDECAATVHVSADAAKLLDNTFKTDAVKAGLLVGTATITAQIAGARTPGPGTSRADASPTRRRSSR